MTRNERLAQHVRDLCAAFNVRWQEVPGLGPGTGSAGWLNCDVDRPPNQRRFGIRTGPVVCEATYAEAMHELGHCLSAFGYLTPQLGSHANAAQDPRTLRDVRLGLEQEHAAWDWARHYALGGEWTAAMQQVEKFALETYYRGARQYGVQPPRR